LDAPTFRAVLLADGAHRDPTTGKFTLLGIFSTATVRKPPEPGKTIPLPRQFVIYAVIADTHSGQPFSIRLHRDPDWNAPLGQGNLPAAIAPGSALELVVQINNLNIPELGTYYVEISVGGESHSTPLSVQLTKHAPPPAADE
jgi:hypothetical protein